MPATPGDLRKLLANPDTAAARHRRDIERAHAEGVAAGRIEARKEFLDFLQNRYVGPSAPDRTTPEAAAILKLTREMSTFFNGQAKVTKK